MTPVSSPSKPESPETLGLACIGHLQQEEAMLTGTLDLLKSMRDALVCRNEEALVAAIESQDQSETAARELHAARALLRARISRGLGVAPADATLQKLTTRVSGELKERLALGRRRLAALSTEIDSVNRCNAILVQQSVELLNQVLYCLTGQEQGSQRYGATGQMSNGNPGSVIQFEC